MERGLSRTVREEQVHSAKGSYAVRVGGDTDTRNKPRDRAGSQQQT